MPQKGKAPKKRRRRLDPQEKLVHELVQRCWPDTELAEVECSHVADMWSGNGVVYEATVILSSGEDKKLIVKTVNLGDGESEDEVRRRESYCAEATFYEMGHAAELYNLGAECPLPVLVERSSDGSHLSFCLTKLEGVSVHNLSASQTESALSWLARLHAKYWGCRADVAVNDGGLQSQGCFWNLDARAKEHASMALDGWSGRLRLAARGLDARLKADRCQTIVHGDAKTENMLFRGCSASGISVSLCDFQYVGKAHPAKDLAYCLLCVDKDVDEDGHLGFLHYYLSQLSQLLETQGGTPPSFRELQTCYGLCLCDFARWMAGWGRLGVEALCGSGALPR